MRRKIKLLNNDSRKENLIVGLTSKLDYENSISSNVPAGKNTEHANDETTSFDVNFFQAAKDTTDKSGWTIIENDSLRVLILKALADSDKQKIMSLISETPFPIPQILHSCKLPLTTGYRKINSLIKEGFMIPSGMIRAPKKRDVIKYGCIFEDVKIIMDKNSAIVSIKLRKQNT